MNGEIPPTRQEVLASDLKRIAENGDTEGAHLDMDNRILEELESLGYTDAVQIFKNKPKWYA